MLQLRQACASRAMLPHALTSGVCCLLALSVAMRTAKHDQHLTFPAIYLLLTLANLWVVVDKTTRHRSGPVVNALTCIWVSIAWACYAHLARTGRAQTLVQFKSTSGLCVHLLAHSCGSLVTIFGHQGYAHQLLPLWARFLVAEVYAISKWHATCLSVAHLSGAWQLVLTLAMLQCIAVAVPLWVFPSTSSASSLQHPGQRQQQPKQADAGLDSACSHLLPDTDRGGKHGPHCAGSPDVKATLLPKSSEPESTCPVKAMQRPVDAATDRGYTSVLGDRFTVSIKISTRHQPSDLNTEGLARLVQRVERAGGLGHDSAPNLVLRTCIRQGCILIGMDVCNPFGPGNPGEQPTLTEAQVLQYAQQVLPTLLTELGLCSSTEAEAGCGGNNTVEAGPVLHPNEPLSLRIGGHTVRATLHPDTHEWVLEVQPPHPTWSVSMAWPCVPEGPSASDPGVASSPAAIRDLTFTVQLSGDIGGDSGVPVLVTGANPAKLAAPVDPAVGPAKTSANSSDEELQVWVMCQGQYLATTVRQVEGSSPQLLRVTAKVPADALARHHQPDGPAARLQLATVELWQGTTALLSTTPLVWDAVAHMAPLLEAPQFGWWGVSCNQASEMVRELLALTDAAQAAGTEAATRGHTAFVGDLEQWLYAAQQWAPGGLCDMCEGGSRVLSLEQCMALANSLSAHAAASNMPAIASVVRAQRNMVFQPQMARINTAQSTVPWLTCLMQQAQSGIQHAMGLHRCRSCDQLLYGAIRRHVGQAQAAASLIMGITTWAAFVGISPDAPPLVPTLIAAICVLRILGVSSSYPPPAHALRPTGSILRRVTHAMRYRGGLQLLAYVLYLGVMVCVMTGTMEVSPDACRTSRLGAFMTTHAFFLVLVKHVHLWGRFPDWLVRGLVVLESCAHFVTTHKCPTLHAVIREVWMTLGTPVVAWGLYCYWRRVLRPRQQELGRPHGPVAAGQGLRRRGSSAKVNVG